MKEMQAQVNQGAVIIAVWQNPNPKESGHVAGLVPGEVHQSSTWQGIVPMAMETGSKKRWAAKSMSFGFGKEKKVGTKFFRYQGPLK